MIEYLTVGLFYMEFIKDNLPAPFPCIMIQFPQCELPPKKKHIIHQNQNDVINVSSYTF